MGLRQGIAGTGISGVDQGAGPIGALAALAARSYGVTEVIVTDLVPSRWERILQFGATASQGPTDASFDPAALGVDAFIECFGVPRRCWPAAGAAVRWHRGDGRHGRR